MRTFREACQLALAIAAFLTPVLGYVFGFWSQLATTWAGVRSMLERFPVLEATVEGMRMAMPDPRVTTEGDNLPYVRKPVHLGDRITLIFYIGRTAVGAGCTLTSSMPLFIDSFGVTRPGEQVMPHEQFGLELVRREVLIDMPEGMPAGTASVRLQLQYQCGGGAPIYESTTPVLFDILPAKG